MKAFTADELDLLIATARKVSEADGQLFETMFNHGLRVSEGINLGPDNLVGGSLAVQRLKGSKKTTQTLSPGERDYLLANLPTGQPFKQHRSTVWRKIRRYCKQAGIDLAKAHPHTLKHTTGRLAHEAGLEIPEIQQILGHVDPGNTLIYMEADEDKSYAAFVAKLGR